MITKQWAIQQIQRKWLDYYLLRAEIMSMRPLPDNWHETIQTAHRAYYRTMYPLKDHFSIRHYELVNYLREAENNAKK